MAGLRSFVGGEIKEYTALLDEARDAGPGWERTQEWFADPQSGRSVVVYYRSRTDERRYVAGPD